MIMIVILMCVVIFLLFIRQPDRGRRTGALCASGAWHLREATRRGARRTTPQAGTGRARNRGATSMQNLFRSASQCGLPPVWPSVLLPALCWRARHVPNLQRGNPGISTHIHLKHSSWTIEVHGEGITERGPLKFAVIYRLLGTYSCRTRTTLTGELCPFKYDCFGGFLLTIIVAVVGHFFGGCCGWKGRC